MALGWTQQRLGIESGVSRVSITYYEQGLMLPGPNSRRKLMAALGWTE